MRSPRWASHMHCSKAVAPSGGSVTAPKPHFWQGRFAPPLANCPETHGAHAADGSALLALSPWPATHRQSPTDVLAVSDVFLKFGHERHSGRREPACPPGECEACAQGAHTAGPPEPAEQTQDSSADRGNSEIS